MITVIKKMIKGGAYDQVEAKIASSLSASKISESDADSLVRLNEKARKKNKRTAKKRNRSAFRDVNGKRIGPLTSKETCVHCGAYGTDKNPLHRDHIIPHTWRTWAGLSQDDLSSWEDNGQILCAYCNAEKAEREKSFMLEDDPCSIEYWIEQETCRKLHVDFDRIRKISLKLLRAEMKVRQALSGDYYSPAYYIPVKKMRAILFSLLGE